METETIECRPRKNGTTYVSTHHQQLDTVMVYPGSLVLPGNNLFKFIPESWQVYLIPKLRTGIIQGIFFGIQRSQVYRTNKICNKVEIVFGLS